VFEEQANPRDSFAGHAPETPWDKLQLPYFHGYTIWNLDQIEFESAPAL
jgi:hypothetical protein